MLKVLGAALAAVMFAAPAGATVYKVETQATFDLLGRSSLEAGAPVFIDAYFPTVELSSGDTIDIIATLAIPVPYTRLPTQSPAINAFALYSLTTNPLGSYICPSNCDIGNVRLDQQNKLDTWIGNTPHDSNVYFQTSLTNQTIVSFTSSLTFIGPQSVTLDIAGIQALTFGVPELSTWGMMICGATALFLLSLKRRNAASASPC